MAFEFDPHKSLANKDKHGIDFEEAQALWLDDKRIELSARHDHEPRQLLVGAIDGKHWSAIFTMRDDRIRLISVRRSRASEVRLYEGKTDDSE
jgi:uncharacterized DUF497 family protein